MQTAHSTSAGGLRGPKPVLGKRPADDSRLNDEDRFTKRLNLLTLDGNGSSTYYVPVSSEPAATPPATVPSRSNGPPTRVSADEHMHLDDTRDRVYIHNLDDELSDIESDEEKLIFLPDIERHFSKIPQHVLNPQGGDGDKNQEIVLYSIPKSLTVDESHDSVRKAIIESRQRAREAAVEEARIDDMNRRYEQTNHQEPVETAHGYSGDYMVEEEIDPDDMDMS